MTKRERVTAALLGEELDRVPVSLWGHDFLREWSAAGLAAAMVEPVREFDYDYLKVNPRATYFAEAWGCTFRPSNDAARQPELEHWILRDASDLEAVTPADATGGSFGEQLQALRLIGRELRGEVPFMQTVFSPLSVIGRMTGGGQGGPSRVDIVREWMSEAPPGLESALDAVTETLAAYARACLDAGAEGIFFATTDWGTRDACSDEEYETFGRPYDMRVLKAVEGAPFNVLHVCRPNNMLLSLLDYPVAAFNWAVHDTGNPSLAEAQAATNKAVMGGVNERRTLITGVPEEVASEVEQALDQTGGRRYLLAPGCSISPQTPPENIRAAVDAARNER